MESGSSQHDNMESENGAAYPLSQRLDFLHQRRLAAVAIFAETMEKLEIDFRQRESEINLIHENLISVVQNLTQEFHNQLSAQHKACFDELSDKMAVFTALDDENSSGIDDLNAIQSGLKDTVRHLGLHLQ